MIVKTRTMRWPVFAVIRFALSRDLRGLGGVLMKKWFIFIACVWAFQASAQTTYPAASCSQIAVSAAIAAEQVHPVDGDIISIPAGTCTWTGTTPLSASFKNSVTIQGAGAISAAAGGASTTGSDVTIINDGNTSLAAMTFNAVAGKSFRLTGIAILSTVGSNGIIQIFGTSSSVRVDHCHFHVTNVGLYIGGSLLGVADHDFFDSSINSVNNPIAFHNGVGWNGTSESGNAIGDHSWTDTDHFGTSGFFFVEDTRFNEGSVSDAHDGARYVLRHNTIQSSVNGNGQVYNHGLTSSRARATRAAEVYLNNFVQPGPTGGGNPAYALNSGTLLFWGNTVTQYRSAVQIDYTRKDNTTYPYGANPSGWGNCGITRGPSNWDENTNSSGYACLDSPARGAGQLLSGDFPSVVNTNTSSISWPHQARSPIYIWNNTYTPSGGYSGTSLISSSSMFTDNTDYYQQFAANAEPGSFNGTTGVGQGLLSARPSTCTAGPGGNTPGVGYWATDTNTLYVCNPTNTWTVYYTPYAYPHPLIAGGTTGTAVNPPANLAATVQ
jgi:hypothetical protein